MTISDRIKGILDSILSLSNEDRAILIKELNSKFGVDFVVDSILSLDLLGCRTLVNKIQQTLGIDFSAMSTVSSSSTKEETVKEDKKNVVLVSIAEGKKLNLVKVLRDMKNLNLIDLKKIVDNLPYTIEEAVPVSRFEEIKQQLEPVGGILEYK